MLRQFWGCAGEKPEEKTPERFWPLVPEFPECGIHVFFRVVEKQTEFLFIQGGRGEA